MIAVQISNGPILSMELLDAESTDELIQRIKDENQLEFRGNAVMQDTHDGHTMASNEIVTDNRLYYLNVWVWGLTATQ